MFRRLSQHCPPCTNGREPEHLSPSRLGRRRNEETASAYLLKRIIDVIGSLVVLSLGAPLFFCIALAVWLTMGRPVIFSQTRSGLFGSPFTLYKFRTMRLGTGEPGNQVSDAVRLTRFGRFLRSTSLDELPGFINVFRGEMSIVGPRPLLPEYLPLYSDRQSSRHKVRPGITGLAQVSGRNLLTWQERLELDALYVEHWSLGLDLRIILLTLLQVTRRQGISSKGSVTMHRFTGNSPDNHL